MNRMKRSDLLLAENLIHSIIRDYEACGLAAAIIDKNRITQYEQFFGVRDKDTNAGLNGDTIFGLASVTKSFTALSILQLEEQGLLKLDDPISRYIPEFTNQNQPDPVTIRHLLSHCGGFFPLPRILIGDVAQSLGLREQQDGDFAYHNAIAQEGARLVASRLDAQTKNHGLCGRPGEYFSYCNDGFGLLSHIIWKLSNEASFADYVTKHITKPLGMERSCCDFISPSIDENAATLYKKKQGIMSASRDYHDNAFVLNGGGAMKSTLNDMKKYVTMYLNLGTAADGTSLLRPYGIREMIKPRQPYGAFGFYGYGLCLKQLDDLKVVEHGGSLPGVSSHIAWSYEAEAAVIVLCNTSDVPVSLISDALLRAYNGKNPLDRRDIWQETSWTKETLSAAAGCYRSGEGTEVEIYVKANGDLGFRSDGSEKNLVPVCSDAAIVRGPYSDTYLKLIFNEDHRVFAIAYGSRMIPRC